VALPLSNARATAGSLLPVVPPLGIALQAASSFEPSPPFHYQQGKEEEWRNRVNSARVRGSDPAVYFPTRVNPIHYQEGIRLG